jgi:hypothetical protein
VPRYEDLEALLAWRQATARATTGRELADSLSCEGLDREVVPARWDAAVTSFRHLGQGPRERTCARYLRSLRR